MPDSFRFTMEPMFLLNDSRVVLLSKDFERLLKLAENWIRIGHDDEMRESTPNNSLIENTFNPWAGIDDFMGKINVGSRILNSAEGQKLGKSPLDFLSKELYWFTTATQVFSTESILPNTHAAAEFHRRCNNLKNVLVIIKSGQYIAGGYTEVPFESREYSEPLKADPSLSTFLFSANRRKVYRLKTRDKALFCGKEFGPVFGFKGLYIGDDYSLQENNGEGIYYESSSFHSSDAVQGELFGTQHFPVDKYEVWCLK